MKQVLQSIKSGATQVVDVPVPKINSDEMLIQTKITLVSSGTEKMLVDFGKASLFKKAAQKPEKLKEVLQKIKTDGPANNESHSFLINPCHLVIATLGWSKKLVNIPFSD